MLTLNAHHVDGDDIDLWIVSNGVESNLSCGYLMLMMRRLRSSTNGVTYVKYFIPIYFDLNHPECDK